jgi:type II secretory pathway pseudopilin PulG
MQSTRALRRSSPRQRGFTFIGVLIASAVIGVGLAGLGQVWSVQAQRERERELLFVGDQYRNAILSYSASTPAGKPRYPRDLDELLDDRRHPVTRRHLRQLYPDPLTGMADWETVRSPEGGIVAVHSRHPGSPMKVGNFPRQFSAFETAATYRDWVFGAPPPKSPTPQR